MSGTENRAEKPKLWEDCEWCAGPLAALMTLKNWMGSGRVSLRGMRLSGLASERMATLNVSTLDIECTHCRGRRRTLTLVGRELAESLEAERRAEDESGVNLSKPPDFTITEGE